MQHMKQECHREYVKYTFTGFNKLETKSTNDYCWICVATCWKFLHKSHFAIWIWHEMLPSSLLKSSFNISVLDKPDPPAGVPAASDVRRSSLTLSWYGPTYDGGSIVKSYNLEIWNSLDNTWSDLTSCNSTSFHVQQLLCDRQYKFRVRAVNMYGIGEPSAESEPVTVGEPVVPGERERMLMSIELQLHDKCTKGSFTP